MIVIIIHFHYKQKLSIEIKRHYNWKYWRYYILNMIIVNYLKQIKNTFYLKMSNFFKNTIIEKKILK